MTHPPNTFMPQPLTNRHPQQMFTRLAPNYFRVANELRDMAHCGTKWPEHYYVLPAVAMYVAAFEAFLQEKLALARVVCERKLPGAHAEDVLKKIEILKEQRAPS